MTIDQLNATIEKYRAGLAEKSGSLVMFAETGPASMGLIDALVKVIESHEQRIKALESAASVSRP